MREAKVIVIALDPAGAEVAFPVASWQAATKLERRIRYNWRTYDKWKYLRMYRAVKQTEFTHS